MIITCPACATQFRVDGTKISTAGTKVRCARCSHVWLQTPDKALPYPGAPAMQAAQPQAPPPPRPRAPPPPPRTPEPPPLPPSLAAEEPSLAGPPSFVVPSPFNALPPRMPEPRMPEPRAPDHMPPPLRAEPGPERIAEPPLRPVRAPDPLPQERLRPAAPPRPPRPTMPFPSEEPARDGRGLSVGLLITLASAMLLVGGLAYGLLHYRGAIAERVPIMGRFYDAIGLEVPIKDLSLQNIRYVRTFEDGVPILEVRGEVVNSGAHAAELPRIQAVLRDKDGTVLSRWTFAATKTGIDPKERVGFMSRYPSPPPHAVSLGLSLAGRGAN